MKSSGVACRALPLVTFASDTLYNAIILFSALLFESLPRLSISLSLSVIFIV